MRVSIDKGKCSGYANCVVAAPDVFNVDDVTGKAVVLVENPGPELTDDVEEAARVCPVEAVLLADTG